MQEDHWRVSSALAANHHPLIEPAQLTICDLGDTAWHDLAVLSAERWSPSKTPHVLTSDRVGPSKSIVLVPTSHQGRTTRSGRPGSVGVPPSTAQRIAWGPSFVARRAETTWYLALA